MSIIAKNINSVKSALPPEVKLIAVSKTKPNAAILEAYAIGQRIFGENKVQELVNKYESLPKDIEWHMIGHLQTNKVKYIAPFIKLIHGVDSYKLLTEINKQAKKNDRIIDVLLQFYIAKEETKYGFTIEEIQSMLGGLSTNNLANVRITGVMGMASFTEDYEKIRHEFRTLKSYFDLLKQNYFANQASFKEISMGMSGDFEIAIEEGSTMIRIGSTIFGER